MTGYNDTVKRHLSRFSPKRGGRVRRSFLLYFAIGKFVECHILKLPDFPVSIVQILSHRFTRWNRLTQNNRSFQGFASQSMSFTTNPRGGRGDTAKTHCVKQCGKTMRYGGSAGKCPGMLQMRGCFSCRSARYRKHQESGTLSIIPAS